MTQAFVSLILPAYQASVASLRWPNSRQVPPLFSLARYPQHLPFLVLLQRNRSQDAFQCVP